MADQSFNDFLPPEMRKFAEQSVQQAKKAFDDLMTVLPLTPYSLLLTPYSLLLAPYPLLYQG